MFKGSNNVALGYDEGSILIKVCQLCDLYNYNTFVLSCHSLILALTQ